MEDFFEEYGMGLLIGVVAIVALATQIPTIQESIARNQSVAQANKARVADNQTMNAEKLAMKQSKELADSRYDSGCEVLSTLRSFGTAAAIQEGRPIVAGAYAKQFNPAHPNPDFYLGRDVVVCDLYGSTAITRWDNTFGYAVAQSLATTNDRDRMAKAQKRKPGLSRPNLTN
jgi:hypothetical protein